MEMNIQRCVTRMIKLNSFVKESLRFITPIVGRIASINFCDTNNDEELQGQNPTEFHAYHYLECNSPATKLECNFFIIWRTNNEEIEPKRRYLGPFPLPVKVDLVFENRKEIVN
ncbi:hypothetical protein C2G38_2194164 [Gigaspora rosea]|uniref:Uncharacterized protein n=1 Tax=Gigaspora rosea TaxID=44941 RepID=A0A397V161_9GLOM|nr:hypothetical protein C2G38_2194164 [Gigaspora rosea]